MLTCSPTAAAAGRADYILRKLPLFLQILIAALPSAGEGVHAWLYRVSRQLHHHLPVGEIVALLESLVAHCGRPVSRKEILDAVQNSMPCAWQPRGVSTPFKSHGSRWPKRNLERIEAIRAEGRHGIAALQELSAVRFEDNEPHTEVIIDRLFPTNALLCCCAAKKHKFDTRPREAWRGDLSSRQYIVPSPMSALTGLTKEGKESAHALANTGHRRFLVCEFDAGTTDEQAALLIHLGGYAPLVCAVHSGGKSLHGWFFVEGEPDAKVERFFRYAVSLGADHATWTRSQFVRMPDGKRDNGKLQAVLFLNFRPMEVKA